MELSIYLAKLIGLFLLIIACIALFRKKGLLFIYEDVFTSPGLLTFAGVISLGLGLAITIGHPIWKLNWQGLITVMGYLIILQGIVRLSCPGFAKRTMYTICSRYCNSMLILLFLLGIYLTYHGFCGNCG